MKAVKIQEKDYSIKILQNKLIQIRQVSISIQNTLDETNKYLLKLEEKNRQTESNLSEIHEKLYAKTKDSCCVNVYGRC